MNYKNYRLYFGKKYVIGERLFRTACYTKVVPTHMFFKARNLKEADRKARKFIKNADLRGIYQLKLVE